MTISIIISLYSFSNVYEFNSSMNLLRYDIARLEASWIALDELIILLNFNIFSLDLSIGLFLILSSS
ncbi:hypothetical protein BAN_0900004 [Borrelia anserina BA2]|uniref:Uncharacterized protein n=1 Tax=Borrelia anserina BA2 TaxID=1313293 RepID=W5STB6_BORAN|nr:hypothetical protein BAN_0900004 [Borrelia anserina BA2]